RGTSTPSEWVADCAGGVAGSRAALASREGVAVVDTLAALAAAPERAAVTPLTAGGTPVAAPPKLMLPAPTTETAAMLMLPAAPMPASPALTVPTGAIRSTLPAGSLVLV